MPNWVYNGLTIEGNPEQVESLVKQLNTPFVDYIEATGDLSFGVKQRKYVNPIFSFRNIIAPTDLETYKQQPQRSELDVNDPNWWSDTMKIAQSDNSWYNFNNREWGTKWDVAVAEDDKYPETYMEGPVANGENLVVYYNFNTAWSRPLPALEKLSAQYPTLLFTLSYEEETGWGGEMEFLRGVIISDNGYDSKCNECDNTDCLEWCEDCSNEVCSVCKYGAEDICEIHKDMTNV